MGTSNGIISIPIIASMGHQREEGENKTGYFQCFIERENNIVFFPPFPVGFITASAVATATQPLGHSPAFMPDLSSALERIQRLETENKASNLEMSYQ